MQAERARGEHGVAQPPVLGGPEAVQQQPGTDDHRPMAVHVHGIRRVDEHHVRRDEPLHPTLDRQADVALEADDPARIPRCLR
jgi:hypothetical protein